MGGRKRFSFGSRKDRPTRREKSFSDVNESYKIGETIGSGSFGVVRKCTDRKTGMSYAVKTIPKSADELDTLRVEMNILNQVDHPNIIKLINVYEDDKEIHMITELCTGGELYDKVVEKTVSSSSEKEGQDIPFSERNAAFIICQILDAITYCHEKEHIVHRDIRPENILLVDETDDVNIKIIDFGISHLYGPDCDPEVKLQQIIGTSYYSAPEMWEGSYSNKVDVWSIGIIAYFLLCGSAPFNGEEDAEVVKNVQTQPLTFPSWGGWKCRSDNAKEFIKGLLEKNPNNRPTAREALRHPWITKHCGKLNIPRSAPISPSSLSLLSSSLLSSSSSSLSSSSSSVSDESNYDDPSVRRPGGTRTSFQNFLQNIKFSKQTNRKTLSTRRQIHTRGR